MSDLIKALGQELADKVNAALKDKNLSVFLHDSGKKVLVDDDNFVPLAEHKKLKEQYRESADQAKQVQEKLKEMAKSVEGQAELKSKFETMQQELEQTQKDHKAAMAKMDKQHRIERALVETHGANKAKPVIAMLNMDGVSVDGENLIGLDAQVEGLKKSDPYLFQTKKIEGAGGEGDEGAGGGAGGGEKTDLGKISMDEYMKARGYDGVLKMK